MKNRRPLLYLAIMFFAITAASIIMIVMEVQKCYADSTVNECVGIAKNGARTYLYLKDKSCSIHVFWANYAITLDYTRKMRGTHSDEYMTTMKPPKFVKNEQGQNMWNPEYLKWLSKLNYTHMTGDVTVTLGDNSGTDSVYKTKQGKYFFQAFSDNHYDAYLRWCNDHGVRIAH